MIAHMSLRVLNPVWRRVVRWRTRIGYLCADDARVLGSWRGRSFQKLF